MDGWMNDRTLSLEAGKRSRTLGNLRRNTLSGCVPEREVGDSISVSLLSKNFGESKRFLSSDISVFLCSS